MNPSPFESHMREALTLAQRAADLGEIPVGAVVVSPDGAVIGRGFNTRELQGNPLGHAEVIALQDAAQNIGDWRLDQHTMVVTLEPCTMCAGALVQARIGHIVFGAFDEKAGAVGSLWDVVRDRRLAHRAEVSAGLLAVESAALLSSFFKKFR